LTAIRASPAAAPAEEAASASTWSKKRVAVCQEGGSGTGTGQEKGLGMPMEGSTRSARAERRAGSRSVPVLWLMWHGRVTSSATVAAHGDPPQVTPGKVEIGY